MKAGFSRFSYFFEERTAFLAEKKAVYADTPRNRYYDARNRLGNLK